ARRLAITDRHLRRLLLAELGTTPLALARTARLQTARRLLAETGMPVTEIAFASGFSSVRQFNASFQEAYGRPPSALRSRGPRPRHGETVPGGTWLTLRLACREPFDGRALLRYLAARAIPGVEDVAHGRYTRTVRVPGGWGVVELTPSPAARSGGAHVLLRARLTGLRGVGQVVSRCRQLFDLDADPQAIAAALAADEALAPLVAARPGTRVPGAYDGFELAVRAVLGQQISVPAASTLAGRLAARYGTPVDAGGRVNGAAEPARPLKMLFPLPGDLADADLSGLGLTTRRQVTLRALGAACADGRLNLNPGTDPQESAARLAELPGVGPWTVAYILMRAVHDPDAFPGSDLGIRRAMERLGCEPERAGRWRPWRAYAALHLWAALADPAAPSAPAGARAVTSSVNLAATSQE
ncbi:MAG TPA: AlkA N-terminal domain-containing protein, partial [Streptosporangiaceae bacterium]|nr:AlkA N-terminal domain-containing protein [Streptosporangiaceae bacterium]